MNTNEQFDLQNLQFNIYAGCHCYTVPEYHTIIEVRAIVDYRWKLLLVFKMSQLDPENVMIVQEAIFQKAYEMDSVSDLPKVIPEKADEFYREFIYKRAQANLKAAAGVTGADFKVRR